LKFITEYFSCNPESFQDTKEIIELYNTIEKIQWTPDFKFTLKDKPYSHQSGYNKILEVKLEEKGWELQPFLHRDNKLGLKGDFKKNSIFVEVQFGNSSTIYRDYYKFHYGLTYDLLDIGVLVVPVNPKKFFPTRPNSVVNMAEFNLAKRTFNNLTIPVPILLIGLLPEN
jgi:hypothetical protein